MRRSQFIPLALVFVLTSTLTACAHMTGPDTEALARLLGRRIGGEGTRLYPGIFIALGMIADESCQQLPEGGTPALTFSLIAKAIETQTDDPFLVQDLKDATEIMGIDLNNSLEVINLTPEIRTLILQFVCSFAQGVDRAKRDL